MSNKDKKNINYNEEPVFYCRHCLSLRIMRLLDTADTCYCDECGSTDIESCSIEEWQELTNN